jgi:hypothetical protein
MVTIEGIINVLKEKVRKMCEFHNEQRKLGKPSLAGHLLLLQLNSLHLLSDP